MYLTTEVRAKEPWTIKELNKKVYTLDGFCIYLSREPKLTAPSLLDPDFSQWLGQALGMEELAGLLMTTSSMEEKIGHLLQLCPVTREVKVEAIYQTIQTPEEVRLKNAGDLALAEGGWRKALGLYRKAMAIKPESKVANNMGIAMIQLGELESAIKAFNLSMSLEGSDEAFMNLVRVKILMEDWLGVLEALNDRPPLLEASHVWYYYAISFEALGRMEESAGAYIRAMDEKGDFSFLQGLVRVSHEDFLKDWMNHRKLKGDFRLYVEGWLDRYKGDDLGYVSCLESALEVAQDKEGYLWELADYCLDQGQVIRAFAFAEDIRTTKANKDRLQILKARIAAEAGKEDVYRSTVDGLINEWKTDVRRNSGRQAGL